MSRVLFLTPLVLSFVAGMVDDVSAQSVGQRTVGRALSRRLGPGAAPPSQQAAGQLQGTERFMRGNRRATDFVGADTGEMRTFVGEQAAEVRGTVRSAVSDLRPMREQNVNTAVRKMRGKQMYNPRLSVGFNYRPLANQELSSRIAAQLDLTETLDLRSPIEVSVQDGTATLRGVVISARDREMAALIVQFEPGIASVRNELKVQPASPPAEQPRLPNTRGQPPAGS